MPLDERYRAMMAGLLGPDVREMLAAPGCTSAELLGYVMALAGLSMEEAKEQAMRLRLRDAQDFLDHICDELSKLVPELDAATFKGAINAELQKLRQN